MQCILCTLLVAQVGNMECVVVFNCENMLCLQNTNVWYIYRPPLETKMSYEWTEILNMPAKWQFHKIFSLHNVLKQCVELNV